MQVTEFLNAQLLTQLAYAIGLACLWAFPKYFTSADILTGANEPLDPVAIVQTLLIGAVVGYLSFQYGLTYDQAATWLAVNGFSIVVFNYIATAIVRQLRLLHAGQFSITIQIGSHTAPPPPKPSSTIPS
jgi:hypothetical protein